VETKLRLALHLHEVALLYACPPCMSRRKSGPLYIDHCFLNTCRSTLAFRKGKQGAQGDSPTACLQCDPCTPSVPLAFEVSVALVRPQFTQVWGLLLLSLLCQLETRLSTFGLAFVVMSRPSTSRYREPPPVNHATEHRQVKCSMVINTF